jgi:hypothetical protein
MNIKYKEKWMEMEYIIPILNIIIQ